MIDIKNNSTVIFISIIVIQIFVILTTFYNISILRQLLGFIYYTFIIGYIISNIFEINYNNLIEQLIICVGLSISFLIFFGLIINQVFYEFGIFKPLSLKFLLIFFHFIPLLLLILNFLLKKDKIKYSYKKLYNLKIPYSYFLFFSIPIFSIVSIIRIINLKNNLLNLLLIIFIIIFYTIISIYNRYSSHIIYSLTIFIISISIIYQSTLTSNYLPIFGSDSPSELLVFINTLKNSQWVSTINKYGYVPHINILNSMLSITILPSIYSILLNIQNEWVFKLIYPLFLAMIPLTLYQTWKQHFDIKIVFFASFFFISNITFYTEMVGLNRQIIAELFEALLIFVIFNKKIKSYKKSLLFIIFSASLAVSHYAISIIFVTFILLIWTYNHARAYIYKNNIYTSKIKITMILFSFVFMFSWYMYTEKASTLDGFISYSDYVFKSLNNFFNFASRDPTILRALGLEKTSNIWQSLSRLFAYLTEFFIIIGFIGLIFKKIQVKLDQEYFSFIGIAMLFLVATIIIPGLSDTMNMTRFYHILLFWLAPLCPLGAKLIVSYVSPNKKETLTTILLLTVLISYFLFQTNFVYEVTGSESWSLPLSSYRMSGFKKYANFGYIDDWSYFGSSWLYKNIDTQKITLYADPSSQFSLRTYAYIWIDVTLSNNTVVQNNSIVYLSPFNVFEKKIATKIATKFEFYNYTETSFFSNINKIYGNGGVELYGKYSNN